MNFNDTYDVIIVGAGPAGTSCAIRLASAGLKVLLIEKTKFPREKLCGEFISPECLGHFEELGVMPNIDRSAGTELAETIFFKRNGKGISFRSEWFGGENALGLSRAEMDNILMNRAKEIDVEVREETTATGLLLSDSKVIGANIKTVGEVFNVRAHLVIDAGGRTHSIGRQFENKTTKKPATFVAFKTHLKGAEIKNNACEIYSYDGGYGGCNRVQNGFYNLCFIASAESVKKVGSDAEQVFRNIVLGNKRAFETLSNAEAVMPWLAVPVDRFGRAELTPAAGLLAIGDAAAFIDPFTGSGILLALESAKIASSAIIEGSTNGSSFERIAADYRENYSAAFGTRLRICSALRNAAFLPWLAEPIISLLGVNDNFRRIVARSTRGSF